MTRGEAAAASPLVDSDPERLRAYRCLPPKPEGRGADGALGAGAGALGALMLGLELSWRWGLKL